MKNVVFVAPYLAETTLRFVSAVIRQPGARVTVLSRGPHDRLSPGLRERIAAFHRLAQGLDPQELAGAVAAAQRAWGRIDVLLGALEELQVPLGAIRDHLGIPGMSAATAEYFRDKSRIKRVLREAGVPWARHALALDPAEARAFAGAVVYPVIL